MTRIPNETGNRKEGGKLPEEDEILPKDFVRALVEMFWDYHLMDDVESKKDDTSVETLDKQLPLDFEK